MDQGNFSGSQQQQNQANPQTGAYQANVLEGAAEKILAVHLDSPALEWRKNLDYLVQAACLHVLANAAEELKPTLAPLDGKGAITLKEAETKKLEKYVEAILKPRPILKQIFNGESKEAQNGAAQLGIKLSKGNKGHAEAVKTATLIQQEFKHFNSLKEKVSPKIPSENYVIRLSEKMNSFKDEIITHISSLESQIRIHEGRGEILPDPKPSQHPTEDPRPTPTDEKNWRREYKTSTRTCPVTKGNMLEVKYGGVDLDVSSKGVWFDYGELRAILGEDDDKRKFAATTIRENQNINGNPYIQTLKHFIQQLNARSDESTINEKAQIASSKRAANSKSQQERETAVKEVIKLIEQKKALESEGFTFLECEQRPGGGPTTPVTGPTTPVTGTWWDKAKAPFRSTPGVTTPTTPGSQGTFTGQT
jgi:Zn-finger nucleic acid-binding protein